MLALAADLLSVVRHTYRANTQLRRRSSEGSEMPRTMNVPRRNEGGAASAAAPAPAPQPSNGLSGGAGGGEVVIKKEEEEETLG